MAAQTRGDAVRRRATYTTLSGIFMALFAMFYKREQARDDDVNLKPFDLGLLALATYRTSRMVAYDKIASAYREPFTETEPDKTGAGATTVPQGTGVRRALGELITCPVCNGTWIAALLVYGLRIAPRPTRIFLAIMGTAGANELLDAAGEALEWTGQARRIECGPRY